MKTDEERWQLFRQNLAPYGLEPIRGNGKWENLFAVYLAGYSDAMNEVIHELEQKAHQPK